MSMLAPPPPAEARVLIFVWKVLALTVAVPIIAALPIWLGLASPGYAAIFTDFGVELPAATRALLSVGLSLQALGVAGIILLGLTVGALAGGLGWFSWRRPVTIYLMLLFAVAGTITMAVAFHRPMLMMIESLQASRSP
jgi:type II secretory pathway component PulF